MIGLLIIFIPASIMDMKAKTVPLYLPLLALLIRVGEYMVQPDGLGTDLIYASVIFIIMLLGAFMGGVGGADVLLGALTGLYMGIYGLYAILLAGVISLPHSIAALKKDKEYPFVPYLFLGVICALCIWSMKGVIRWY